MLAAVSRRRGGQSSGEMDNSLGGPGVLNPFLPREHLLLLFTPSLSLSLSHTVQPGLPAGLLAWICCAPAPSSTNPGLAFSCLLPGTKQLPLGPFPETTWVYHARTPASSESPAWADGVMGVGAMHPRLGWLLSRGMSALPGVPWCHHLQELGGRAGQCGGGPAGQSQGRKRPFLKGKGRRREGHQLQSSAGTLPFSRSWALESRPLAFPEMTV